MKYKVIEIIVNASYNSEDTSAKDASVASVVSDASDDTSSGDAGNSNV